MESDEKDRKLRETGTAYVAEVAETDEMMRVSFDVPQALWKRFMRWADWSGRGAFPIFASTGKSLRLLLSP